MVINSGDQVIITWPYKATAAYLILNGKLFQFDLNAWDSRKGCWWAAIGKGHLLCWHYCAWQKFPFPCKITFRECGNLHTRSLLDLHTLSQCQCYDDSTLSQHWARGHGNQGWLFLQTVSCNNHINVHTLVHSSFPHLTQDTGHLRWFGESYSLKHVSHCWLCKMHKTMATIIRNIVRFSIHLTDIFQTKTCQQLMWNTSCVSHYIK